MTEAVSIKSAAARRHAMRHCVMRVNSQNAANAHDSALDIVIDIIYLLGPVYPPYY